MDWLTFISNTIKAISWPTAVIILVIILRRPLVRLLLLLRRLKYKDLELDFGERLEELEDQAEKADLPPQLPPPQKETIAGIDPDTRKSLRQMAIIGTTCSDRGGMEKR